MIDLTHDDRIRRDAEVLEARWSADPRWSGIERAYSAEDVLRLRGSVAGQRPPRASAVSAARSPSSRRSRGSAPSASGS